MNKRILIIIGSLIIVIAIAVGSLFLKWPQETYYAFRMLPHIFVLKSDIKRVHGLQELKKEILDYVNRFGMLPASVNQLGFNDTVNPSALIDPKTRKSYEYRTAPKTVQRQDSPNQHPLFEICATFQGPSPIFQKNITPPCKGICTLALYFEQTNPFEPENKNFEFWDHEKGYNCWVFDSTGKYIGGGSGMD